MTVRPFLILFICSAIILFGYFAIPAKSSNFPKEFKVPKGLPEIPWPEDNAYSQNKAELGRLLYFDKRLSSDETISCASCHNIPCAYSDCREVAIGIGNAKGNRNSPTIINAAYSKFYFWDGRALSLEEQCKGPLANVKEMTTIDDVHQAHSQCVEKVKAIPGYRKLFRKSFGYEEITIDEIAQAISTFERTIVSGNAPLDRYRLGDRAAMTPEQIEGMKIFVKVNCIHCHKGYNLTDDKFHNIGVGMDKPNPDLGRYEITGDEEDWGAFKTPTLREVAHTAPYMHDGSIPTLEEVVEYYDRGGNPNKNLHPIMRPLNLTSKEKKALVSFMKSLNGEGWKGFHEPEKFPE